MQTETAGALSVWLAFSLCGLIAAWELTTSDQGDLAVEAEHAVEVLQFRHGDSFVRIPLVKKSSKSTKSKRLGEN